MSNPLFFDKHEPTSSSTGIGERANAALQSVIKDELTQSRNKQREELTDQSVTSNRRLHTRYDLSIPAVCYPVLRSGEVDISSAISMIVADASIGGLNLWLNSPPPAVETHLLVGVETEPGNYSFCCVKVIALNRNSKGMLICNTAYDGPLHEILQNELLIPVLDRQTMQFRLPFPETTLASLCSVGAAFALALDFVHVCPNCRAVPTVRDGCTWCLSGHVNSSKMIHHFGCANVDFVEAFEMEGELCCQKCRSRRLVVGADFEYLDGPNVCEDCGQSNLEQISIGHCLNCEHRFEMQSAFELELIGYRVNKLNSLDLITTA